MTRTNDMTTWPSIGCERGCAEHHVRRVELDLAHQHGYADLAQVPADLAVRFTMDIWDTARHPVDGGPYCPAHDAVSETILSHRIWEPRETILTLAVLRGARRDQCFVDMGCQIGWYSLLALTSDVRTIAVDADTDNLAMLLVSAGLNGYGDLEVRPIRLGPETPEWERQPIRLAKLDIEGAERSGIRALAPSIDAGLVDHLMIEVSPVFKRDTDPTYYPDLVCDLIDAGYEAYLLPSKSRPPRPFTTAADYLAPYRFDQLWRADLRAMIEGWHQEDCWFRRVGATW